MGCIVVVLLAFTPRRAAGRGWAGGGIAPATSHRDSALIEFGTTSTGDASVCCYVRDNGVGFDTVNMSMLFEPFQRLHSASALTTNVHRVG